MSSRGLGFAHELTLLEYIKYSSNFVPFKTINTYINALQDGTMNRDIAVKNLLGNFVLFLTMGIFLHRFCPANIWIATASVPRIERKSPYKAVEDNPISPEAIMIDPVMAKQTLSNPMGLVFSLKRKYAPIITKTGSSVVKIMELATVVCFKESIQNKK